MAAPMRKASAAMTSTTVVMYVNVTVIAVRLPTALPR